jgi:hypothetical protein
LVDEMTHPWYPDAMTDATISELDRWLGSLDETRVAKELAEKEARAEELEARIRAEVADLHVLQDEIVKARTALDFKRSLAPDPDPQQDAAPSPARGREAIRALMADMPEVTDWTTPKILAELVKRGWADPDDTKSVSLSLSRMYRAKELERPRKGHYRLPRSTVDGDLFSQSSGVRTY